MQIPHKAPGERRDTYGFRRRISVEGRDIARRANRELRYSVTKGRPCRSLKLEIRPIFGKPSATLLTQPRELAR